MQHDHREFVAGCFRCDLSRVECNIPCDDDCDATCHSVHYVTAKKPHADGACRAR